ncbi:MAG: ECF-type sigma factor [Phycisphaerales bacterium]
MADDQQGHPGAVTQLLVRLGDDAAAGERLMPLVYDELRRLAAAFMREERGDHTLQPTALVNEAFLRLFGAQQQSGGGGGEGGGGGGGPAISFRNKAHFMAIAAKVMRRVLLDHARAVRAAKRGGDALKVTLDESKGSDVGVTSDEIIDVSEALDALAKLHPRMARVVEMRFFGGLTIDQTAAALDVATSTIEADWAFARAWLKRELANEQRRRGEGAE